MITSRWLSPRAALAPGSTTASALAGLASDRPVCGPEWLAAWYGAFGNPEHDAILLLEADGRPVGALALTRTRRFGNAIRALASTTNGHSQYAALLIDPASPAAVVDALLDALEARSDWDMLRLQGVEAGHAAFLEDRARRRGLAVDLEHIFANNVMRLPAGGEASPATAKRRARRLRTLAQAGLVTFDLATGPDALREALSEYTAAESRSWKADGGELLASDEAILAFYRGLAAGADMRIYLLRVDGSVIAGLCTVAAGRCIVALKIFHDAAYARSSPGMILLNRLHEDAAADPSLDIVDFHSPREPYRLLSNDVRIGVDLTLWSRSVRARAARAARSARSLGRSLAGRG